MGDAPLSFRYRLEQETTPLKVLVGFNHGTYQSNDITAWLANNPAHLLATNFGVPRELAEKFPHEDRLFIPGKR